MYRYSTAAGVLHLARNTTQPHRALRQETTRNVAPSRRETCPLTLVAALIGVRFGTRKHTAAQLSSEKTVEEAELVVSLVRVGAIIRRQSTAT